MEVWKDPQKRSVMNALCSDTILPVTSSFYFVSSFVKFPLLHGSLSYKYRVLTFLKCGQTWE